MECYDFKVEPLTHKELLETTGGNWFNIYRVLAAELGDFVRGFREGSK